MDKFKKIECAYCNKWIDASESNNGMPLVDGKVCKDCNDTYVLAERYALMGGHK